MSSTQSSSCNSQGEFFQIEVSRLVEPTHRLRVLSDRLDWDSLEADFVSRYSELGRPGYPIRMMLGLLMLKQMYNMSDEESCKYLRDIPGWQYFCGYRFYQQHMTCDATTLGRFRKRIGVEGFERVFRETIALGKSVGVVSERDIERLHVDTTVQEKNIAYPHDAKHLYRVLQRILKSLKKTA